MAASTPERILNAVMSAILRSPLHGIASKQVLLVTMQGRKTGRTITTPVGYSRDDGQVVLFSRGGWVKNLAGGVPVSLRIRGKDYQGFATAVFDDLAAKTDGLFRHLSAVPGDARFFGVTLGEDGLPDRGEVERAARKNTMICVRLDTPAN